MHLWFYLYHRWVLDISKLRLTQSSLAGSWPELGKNTGRKKAKDMVPNDFKVTPDVTEKITDQTADFTFDDDDADSDAFEDSKETPDEDKQDFRSALDFGTPLNFKSSFGQNVARSVS